MRRHERKALTNLGLFVFALFFILWINSSSSTSKSFPWTAIRYQTTSTSFPKPNGICPGLAESTKPALVVSHVASDGDTEWLDALSDRYHICIYEVDKQDSATHLRVPANRGHESMAYLTFLIDNYDSIPSAGAVFVHGSRFAWHNDERSYDNAAALRALDITSALSAAGYHNLRCDWSASTCPPKTPPQGSLENSWSARLEPWSARAVSDAALPGALALLFGHASAALDRAHALRAQCCAQFVVARENVWRHEKGEHTALRQWLLDGMAPADDRISGRIISYIWHILFLVDPSAGPMVDLDVLNAGACPTAAECYCRLYGKCKLGTCSSPGSCVGEYVLPPDFSLPSDWAATHS